MLDISLKFSNYHLARLTNAVEIVRSDEADNVGADSIACPTQPV